LQRTILAHLQKQTRHFYSQKSITMVVKPLYEIAEAGAYWWLTYFKYHCEKLTMEISTYDPCLLIISASSECFGIIEMQINDTLGLSNHAFATKKSPKLVFTAKEKQFLTLDNPLFFLINVFLLLTKTHCVYGRKTRARSWKKLRIQYRTFNNGPEKRTLLGSAS
jgi:hypothetical protein